MCVFFSYRASVLFIHFIHVCYLFYSNLLSCPLFPLPFLHQNISILTFSDLKTTDHTQHCLYVHGCKAIYREAHGQPLRGHISGGGGETFLPSNHQWCGFVFLGVWYSCKEHQGTSVGTLVSHVHYYNGLLHKSYLENLGILSSRTGKHH